MFTNRRTYSFFSLVFFALFCASFAHAQGVGKISAKVTDAKTGEVLVRAAVQIVETKQGAFTKDNGIGTIINVPPSQTYTVTAKYANYKTQTQKNVKVQSDITTSLTFALSTTEQKEIIVQSKKIVEITNTKQGVSFESAEITNVPGRNNLNDIVQLTPGVIRDGGGFVINGSRNTSNSFRVNGMEITDPVNGGTNALQVGISKFAVSELNVTTSGADASNGNASGGFISETTKAGGANFEFNFHYRQEIPALFGSSSNGFKQMAQNDRIYELAMGGPITEDLKYYVTARGNTREFNNIDIRGSGTNNGLAVTDPYGNNAGQLPHNSYYNRALTGKLTFNLFGFNASLDAAYAAINQQINSVGLFYGDRTQLPANNNIDQLYTLNGKGQVGGDGVLEFTAGFGKTDIYQGKYDQSAGGGLFKLYSIYNPKDEWTLDGETGTLTAIPDGLVDIYTPVSRQIPDPRNPANPLNLSGAGINPFTGHIEGGAQNFTTNNAYGLLNTFYSVGNPDGFSYDNYTHIQGIVKYTQQISEHLLNFGLESHFYTLNSFDLGLPWDANSFKDSFYVKPFTGAAYIVDKMEFSEITFNPSLRFDIYNPGNDRYLTDPQHPFKDTVIDGKLQRIYAFATAPVQTQLSPRLGITYAISEQTTFNFNYNLYFKQPLFNEVLRSTGGDFGRVLLRGNQIIGNGALKGERTTEIVVGFTTALTDVMSMTLQGVYKDMRNQTGLQRIASDNLSTGYTLYSDDQYGNSKSVQFSLDKRMRDNYSVRLNYTVSTAKGTSSSSGENYNRLINPPSGENVSVLPLQPFNLGYDRPHVAQLIVALGWNKGEGPTIFGERLLELFNLSFTTEYQSGLPYTKQDLKGQQSGEFNADRNPSYFQTNASLSRSIRLSDFFGESMGTSALDLQLEVLNLLNRTQPISVYPATGQGDNDGQSGVYTGNTVFKNDPTNADGNQLDGVGHLKYNSRWDLNKDNQVDLNEQQQAFSQLRKDGFARRTNYQIPRRIFLNVSFRF